MNRPPWGAIIVLGAAAAAVIVVVARWSWWTPDPSTRPDLQQKVGPADWRFGDSWASTLTAFGVLLQIIMLSGVLTGEGRYLSVRTVGLLNLFFGFLVVLAPFVYVATGSRAISAAMPPGTTPTVAYEGRVSTFLVASALTLWAALGEVTTLGFTAAELAPRGATFYVFAAVLAGVGVLMVVYTWRSVRWILEVQVEHERRLTALGPGAAAARPRWALL